MRPYKNSRYIEPLWEQKLATAGFADFEPLWVAKLPWIEAPNSRRGGWSGVARYQLDANDPESIIYIKRQQNHVYRPLFHPRRGLPTSYREIRNLLYLRKKGIPVVTPIFFDMRRHADGQQAILITKALTDYRSLEEWFVQWQAYGYPSETICRMITAEIATALREMHALGYAYLALKTNHIFIRYDEQQETVDIAFIDMELTRKVNGKGRRIFKDLMPLYLNCRFISLRYHYYFLQIYLNKTKLTSKDLDLVKNMKGYKRSNCYYKPKRTCSRIKEVTHG